MSRNMKRFEFLLGCTLKQEKKIYKFSKNKITKICLDKKKRRRISVIRPLPDKAKNCSFFPVLSLNYYPSV